MSVGKEYIVQNIKIRYLIDMLEAIEGSIYKMEKKPFVDFEFHRKLLCAMDDIDSAIDFLKLADEILEERKKEEKK